MSLLFKLVNCEYASMIIVRNSACPFVGDKWLFTLNNPLAVIRRTSGNLQPYFLCFTAVIERQNTRDFTLEIRQRSRSFATRCQKNNTALTSVICCVVVRKLLYLLWLYIIDDEGIIYQTCAMGWHLGKVGKPTNDNYLIPKAGESNSSRLFSSLPGETESRAK